MTIEVFREKWLGIQADGSSNAMIRGDSTHPLPFFIGYDQQKRLKFMLLSEFEPRSLGKSRSIDVAARQRQDNKWAICFMLAEGKLQEEFIYLCWDLFESSRIRRTSMDGVSFVLERFAKWQRLMELGYSGLLSLSEVKGLLGELIFLERYALGRYGAVVALQGWLGPDKADRDFVFSDLWYEIKTIDPSASEVSISSIEQLDTDKVGQLAVFYAEKTSPAESGSITLNAQVNLLRKLFRDHPSELMLLENKLASCGYIDRAEYDQYVFSFRGNRFFEVNCSFPRLRRKEIHLAIQKVSYSISISAIVNWEIR